VEVFAEKQGYAKGSAVIVITVVPAEERRITFNLDVHLAEEGPIDLFTRVPLTVVISREAPPIISEPVTYSVRYKAEEVTSKRLRSLALNVEGEASDEVRVERNIEDDTPYYANLILQEFNYPKNVTVKITVELIPDVDPKDPHPLEAKPVILEKTVQFEVDVDPAIPEMVKQELVKKWRQRMEALNEEISLEELYDWISQHEEVINMYAAYTELAIKASMR
jgi:hypothetical protein